MRDCCSPLSNSAPDRGGGKTRDLTNRHWSQFLWGASLVAFAAGSLLPGPRPVLWTLALAVAGSLCVANAVRCGRLHCHITGPLFLIAAVVSILRGFEIVAWSWNRIGAVIALGTAFAYLLECFVGRYVRRNERADG